VLGYLAILGLFLLMFSVCFIFGIREWLRPRDAAPLPVDADYVRAENFFGTAFREKVGEWLKTARPLPLPKSSSEYLRTVLEKPGGGKILVMAEGCLLNADAGTNAGQGAGEMSESIFCEGDLGLAPGTAARGEIYARGNVQTGAGARLVALASDGTVLLGADNEVKHWVDAHGAIVVGPGTVAGGRMSSQESIGLEGGVTAESLYAPLIVTQGYSGEETGADGEGNTAPGEKDDERTAEKDGEDGAQPAEARGTGEASWQRSEVGGATPVLLSTETEMVQGNLELPDGAIVQGSLVVQGALRSGGGARFSGSIKASRVELGARNHVRGNVVSGSTLQVGEGSRIAGALIMRSATVSAIGGEAAWIWPGGRRAKC
jgi:hypothetical protein